MSKEEEGPWAGDLAPHFKDCSGNDYVGLDMLDLETWPACCGASTSSSPNPMIYGELIENLPAAELQDLMKGLEESLTYVDHLLRRTSSVKPADHRHPVVPIRDQTALPATPLRHKQTASKGKGDPLKSRGLLRRPNRLLHTAPMPKRATASFR
jgi:hypothetical protein